MTANSPQNDKQAKLLAIAAAFAKFVDEADKAKSQGSDTPKESTTCS